MSDRALGWREVAVLVGAKAALGALALAGGFRAVSDDDFARVVLAQRWAAEPALDPTGTSWLPLPFWIYGAVMKVFGSSLLVARATAFALGLLSVVLLYAAARMLVTERRAAMWGALVAAALPWSVRLGVATVPELPTAALAVFGAATLTAAEPRTRLLGALAISAACLCRYEPWPLALGFGALCVFDAWRKRRASLLLPAAAVVAGSAAWLAHNWVAHGSPLHFATRVSDYWKAVGGSAESALLGYPLSLLREEPELCILAAVVFVAARVRKRPLASSMPRMAGLMAWVLLALTLAALPGGAPTHHAGRALLVLWLVMAIYLGAAAHAVMEGTDASLRRNFALLVVATILVGALVLRPWYARLDDFSPRIAETTIGWHAAQHASADELVLLEVVDYGYYAVLAGSGDPSKFVLDRSIDPRAPMGRSSFDNREWLLKVVDTLGVRCVVAQSSPVTTALGSAVATSGRWGLWCP